MPSCIVRIVNDVLEFVPPGPMRVEPGKHLIIFRLDAESWRMTGCEPKDKPEKNPFTLSDLSDDGKVAALVDENDGASELTYELELSVLSSSGTARSGSHQIINESN